MPKNYFNKYIKYKKKYLNIKNTMSGGSIPDIKITLFSADWCGYCNRFKPEWEKLKKKYNNKYMFVNYKDTDIETKKWKISGFPTIFISNKNLAVQYYGNRTTEAIIDYVNNVKLD